MSIDLDLQSACDFLILILVHFVWQAVAIVAVIGIAAVSLRKASATARYNVCLCGLGVIVLCPVVTARFFSSTGVPVAGFAGLPWEGPSATATPESNTAFDDTERISAVVTERDPLEVETDDANSFAVEGGYTGSSIPSSFAGTNLGSIPVANSTLRRCVAGVYLTGVSLMLVRLLISLCSASSLRRSTLVVDNPQVMDCIAQQVQRMRLRVAPAVRLSQQVVVPTIVGIVRPLVLIPVTFVTELTPSQLTAVLAHEFAHIRRLDPLMNFIQRVVEVAFFFHPAVWLLSRWLTRERELACDEMVVAAGEPAVTYAESLLRAAEIGWSGGNPVNVEAILTLHAVGERSALDHRIRKLLGAPSPRRFRVDRGGITSGVLVLSIMVAASYVWADKGVRETSDTPSVSDMPQTTTDHDGAGDRLRVTMDNLWHVPSAFDIRQQCVLRAPAQLSDEPIWQKRINRKVIRQWADTESRGDFFHAPDLAGFESLRGARMVSLVGVDNWREANLRTTESLLSQIEKSGTDVVIGAKFFAVRSREGRLAVVQLESVDTERHDNRLIVDVRTAQPIVMQTPETPETALVINHEEAGHEGSSGTRHFVRLVVGPDRMTFQGKDVTWDELRRRIAKLPNALNDTVFEFALAQDAPADWDESEEMTKAREFTLRYGFEYLSVIGRQAFSGKGASSETVDRQAESTPKTFLQVIAEGVAKLPQIPFPELEGLEEGMTPEQVAETLGSEIKFQLSSAAEFSLHGKNFRATFRNGKLVAIMNADAAGQPENESAELPVDDSRSKEEAGADWPDGAPLLQFVIDRFPELSEVRQGISVGQLRSILTDATWWRSMQERSTEKSKSFAFIIRETTFIATFEDDRLVDLVRFPTADTGNAHDALKGEKFPADDSTKATGPFASPTEGYLMRLESESDGRWFMGHRSPVFTLRMQSFAGEVSRIDALSAFMVAIDGNYFYAHRTSSDTRDNRRIPSAGDGGTWDATQTGSVFSRFQFDEQCNLVDLELASSPDDVQQIRGKYALTPIDMKTGTLLAGRFQLTPGTHQFHIAIEHPDGNQRKTDSKFHYDCSNAVEICIAPTWEDRHIDAPESQSPPQNSDDRSVPVPEWPKIKSPGGGFASFGSFEIRAMDASLAKPICVGWETIEPEDGTLIVPAGQALQLTIHSFNDTDLSAIRQLADSDLQALSVPLQNKLDDRALPNIVQLQSLVRLELGGSAISDDGVRHLAKLENLKYLSLQGCEISDSAIPSLSKMKSLLELNLRQTSITAKGQARLATALPGCRITFK